MSYRQRWRWCVAGMVFVLGVGGIWLKSQGVAAPRLQKIQVPSLPVDGRFVTATQEGRFMYLFYQTQRGVRVFQLDISRIQSLGDEVHLVGIMDLASESPPGRIPGSPSGQVPGSRRSR